MEIVVISQEQVAAAIAQHIGSEIRLSNVTKTGSYRTFLFENEIEEGTVSEKSKLVWDTIATDEKGHKCPVIAESHMLPQDTSILREKNFNIK